MRSHARYGDNTPAARYLCAAFDPGVTIPMLRSVLLAAFLIAPALAHSQTTPPAATPAPAADGAGDAEAGRRVFNQCRACHTVDQGGRNGVGPNLFGIVGRRAGAVEGFRYSASMQELAGTGHSWTPENLRTYLRDPKSVLPRGTMAFNGVRQDGPLNDLMAYLQTLR